MLLAYKTATDCQTHFNPIFSLNFFVGQLIIELFSVPPVFLENCLLKKFFSSSSSAFQRGHSANMVTFRLVVLPSKLLWLGSDLVPLLLLLPPFKASVLANAVGHVSISSKRQKFEISNEKERGRERGVG